MTVVVDRLRFQTSKIVQDGMRVDAVLLIGRFDAQDPAIQVIRNMEFLGKNRKNIPSVNQLRSFGRSVFTHAAAAGRPGYQASAM